MARFLVAIYRSAEFDAFANSDIEMKNDIDVLNDEMVSAGVRVFVGGLHHARNAKSIRLLSDGEVMVSPGPSLQTTEHVDGFWVLEVADLDEALEWGRKAALSCRAAVEVRAFH